MRIISLNSIKLAFALLGIISVISSKAQTKEFSNNFFSFKIHDEFKLENVEGIEVYKLSTIFLNIKEINTYKSAEKYLQALDDKFSDEMETSRRLDTLDGWPVICLQTLKKHDVGVFKQEYYLFDNGKTVFNLSISGWQGDARFVRNLFSVTKKSFKFKTMRRSIAGVFMDVPNFLGFENHIIWSRVVEPGDRGLHINLEVPIRFNIDEKVKYEDGVKYQVKMLKSDKATNAVNQTMKINDLEVTKIRGTSIKKLNNGIKKEETRLFYCINLPTGGNGYIFFVASPDMASHLEVGLDALVRTVSASR